MSYERGVNDAVTTLGIKTAGNHGLGDQLVGALGQMSRRAASGIKNQLLGPRNPMPQSPVPQPLRGSEARRFGTPR